MKPARQLFAGAIMVAIAACTPKSTTTTAPVIQKPGAPEEANFEPTYLSEWSKTVGGIRARIETAMEPSGYYPILFVRFENVSNKGVGFPPLLTPKDPDVKDLPAGPWSVELLIDGKWTQLARDEIALDEFDDLYYKGGVELVGQKGSEAEVPGGAIDKIGHTWPIYLKPNESALLPLEGRFAKKLADATEYRITLEAEWNESPQKLQITGSARKSATLDRPLSLPTWFPGFVSERAINGGQSGRESHLWNIDVTNLGYARQLLIYPEREVVAELEDRLNQQWYVHMKIYYAMQLAQRGSDAGKRTILEWLKTTDYETTHSVLDALGMLGGFEGAPDWVIDAMIDALRDNRTFTASSNDVRFFPRDTVSSAAEDAGFFRAIGNSKSRRAVPAMLDMIAKKKYVNDAVEALGEIGDPSVIPALKKLIKKGNAEAKEGDADKYVVLKALIKLKADGVFELAAEVCDADETGVEILESIGDKRAAPIFKKIIATTKVDRSQPNFDEKTADLVAAARIALATMEDGDAVARLMTLYGDPDFDEYDRGEILQRLARFHDPRIVTQLFKIIRQDKSGWAVRNAIGMLGNYKQRDVVAGLIDCLSIDLNRDGLKTGDANKYLRHEIATTLAEITGEKIGVNQAEWKKWWNSDAGKNFLVK